MRNGSSGGSRAVGVIEQTGDCGDPDCDACHFARTQGVEHCSKTCINVGKRVGPSEVRAPAHVHSGLVGPVLVVAAQPLTVTVDLGDALSGGLQLQSMARAGLIPTFAAAPIVRLAEQLVAAARAAAKGVGQ